MKKVFFAATLACLMVAASVSAFAVPPQQVFRKLAGTTITTGKCCANLEPAVIIAEPTNVAPVIVTWSSDYSINDEFRFGLSVNGTACRAYGAEVGPLLSIPGSGFLSVTYQWVVFPADGLRQGRNTFQLCGGGANSDAATITIGFNTMSVQTSK